MVYVLLRGYEHDGDTVLIDVFATEPAAVAAMNADAAQRNMPGEWLSYPYADEGYNEYRLADRIRRHLPDAATYYQIWEKTLKA
jgi:hypothetical protein